MAESMYRRFYCDRDGYNYTARVEDHGNGEAALLLVCPKCQRIGEIYRLARLSALPESDREALTQRFGDVIQTYVDAQIQQAIDAAMAANATLQAKAQSGQCKSSVVSYPFNPWRP